MSDSLETIIRKHALKNAFDYGKADARSVMGKVIGEYPDSKKDMKSTMALIAKEVDYANSVPKEILEQELSNYAFTERKEVKRDKWELPGVGEGKVVTRFLPEPNGFPHLGHAKAAFLSSELARQYSGKFLLRFDDTNPEKEKLEFVKALKDDIAWLGLEFSEEEKYVSDFMPQFYDYARKLAMQGDAYVCFCTQEQIKQGRLEKKACACRARLESENKELFEKMIAGGFKEGECILRLKGNLQSDNTVMRDPTLFRIMDAVHYRQGGKYKTWPTYDFEVSVSDSLTGVTHALRSKEYELRDELYYFILEKLELRKPVVYDFSRLNIRGNALSKRLIKPLVDEKKVSGWDDPRLLTLKGLRRRGITPQAIKEFVLGFGLSKVESNPSIEKLLNENAKLFEKTAEHYFLVSKPVKVLVKNSREEFVKLERNPHDASKGSRVLHAQKDFYLSKEDLDSLKDGEFFRLKNLYCVKLLEKTPNGVTVEYAGKDLRENVKSFVWIPVGEAVPAELVSIGDLLDGEEFNRNSLVAESAFCESACRGLLDGEMVFLDRIGLARLDDAKKMRFILSVTRD